MKDELERIMDLQTLWDHRKTPEMDERGKLVRHAGPDWLRSFADELATAMSIPVDDLLIEGRDGTGPKTEVPWFRFASRTRSPSATMDWYCVYLFDTEGKSAFLSLGHGSTVWTGVDFRPRPEEELRKLGEWGRNAVASMVVTRPELTPVMELHSRRSPLGPAYEAGTALCLRYDRHNVPGDEQLVSDAVFFAGLLGKTYQTSDVLPLPVGPAPEVVEVLEATSKAAGKKGPKKGGQGFGLSAAQRSAVELHAMKLAEDYLVAQGWEVDDTSASSPYDFYCVNESAELYVEVKGTTSAGETIVLTRNEVDHHQEVWPNNALALVTGIQLSGDEGNDASGGTLRFVCPWTIEPARLTVVSYLYSVDE
jgi:hypothetical protein